MIVAASTTSTRRAWRTSPRRARRSSGRLHGHRGAVSITDTASVNFVFNDSTAPTNTVTLASSTGAYLAGTTLYYRPAAAGSFTLSSAVVDGGSGPDSATYPAVTQGGWTHGAQTVNTPAGGP